jgi:hypothetical protein
MRRQFFSAHSACAKNTKWRISAVVFEKKNKKFSSPQVTYPYRIYWCKKMGRKSYTWAPLRWTISVCENMLTTLLKKTKNSVTKLNCLSLSEIFLGFLRVTHMRMHNISRNMVNKGCHLMLSAFYSVFRNKHFPFDSIFQLNLSDLSHQNLTEIIKIANREKVN